MVGLDMKLLIFAHIINSKRQFKKTLFTWYELTFTVAHKVILNLSFNIAEPYPH